MCSDEKRQYNPNSLDQDSPQEKLLKTGSELRLIYRNVCFCLFSNHYRRGAKIISVTSKLIRYSIVWNRKSSAHSKKGCGVDSFCQPSHLYALRYAGKTAQISSWLFCSLCLRCIISCHSVSLNAIAIPPHSHPRKLLCHLSHPWPIV